MLTENKTTLSNKALSFIGEEQIKNINDTSSRQARACNSYFDLALNKVLEEGHWSFATVEEPLQKLNISKYSEEQQYVYAIPNNCAIITRIYKRYNRKNMMEQADWDFRFIEEINSTVIICDRNNVDNLDNPSKDEEVVCEYVRVVNNFHNFPAKFFECFILCLAYFICMDITKDVQKTANMLQLYEKTRDEALRRSYNEEGEDKMHWVDPITNSRGL